MRTHKSMALFLVAALLAGPALAARIETTSHRFYPVRVDVDAQGAVTSAEPVGEVMEGLHGSLVAAARVAEFDPATKNGVPVPSRTAVLVTVAFEKSGRNVAARVTNVSAGTALPLAPPRYPRDALVRQVSARVMLRIVFDASGRRDEALSGVERVDGPLKGGQAGRDGKVPLEAEFRAAALEAIAAWTYAPDEVDGQPVAVDVRIPLTFCASRSREAGCPEFPPAPDALVVTPADAAIRLASLRSAPVPKGAAES